MDGALEAERQEMRPRRPDGELVELPVEALNLAYLTSMIGRYGDDVQVERLEAAAPDGETMEAFYGDGASEQVQDANTALGYRVQPGQGGALLARQPDLMAEWQVLSGLDGALLRTSVRGRIERLVMDAAHLAPSELLAFFIRLSEDFPGHRVSRALFAEPFPKTATERLLAVEETAGLNSPAYYGFLGLASALIAAGAEIDDRMSNGAFPLLFAAQEGHAEVVAALLTKGVDPNAVNEQDGAFPLLLAAQNGHAGVVTLLRTHGST